MIPFLGMVVYLSRNMLLPFLLAFFLAYAINPLVEFLQWRGARREYAIITVYLILGITAAVIFGIAVPRLVDDLTRAAQKLPLLIDELQQLEDWVNQLLQRWQWPSNLRFLAAEFTRRGELWLRSLMIDLAGGVVRMFSQSVVLLLVPVLSYYINRDYPRMKRAGYRWLAKNFGEHWTETFMRLDAVLRLYIRGQLLVTLIVGVLISTGLALLGFEIAFFLGLLAGIFNLIPYFGPVLGVLPAAIFGLTKSPWSALYVIGLFIAVNQLETLYLAPKIIGGSLGLHPLFVLYLVLIGGKIFGLWGMIFAVPLGTLAFVLLKSIYEICFGLTRKQTCRESSSLKQRDPD